MEIGLFEVREATFPRKKIEDDLLKRHRQLKRKIDALKIRRLKEETHGMQKAPTINPNSRKIANENEKNPKSSPSRLQRTQEILMNSRFMPKKVKISLEDLDNPNYKLNQFKKTLRYEHANSSPGLHMPLSFPSIIDPRKVNYEITEDNIPLPADIRQRNELLFSLRKETMSRGFHLEPEEPPINNLGVHERTAKWAKAKKVKIEELKLKLDKRTLEGCTFKPDFVSRKCYSVNASKRGMSLETSYSELYARRRNQGNSRIMSCSKSERNLSQDTKTGSVPSSVRCYFSGNQSERSGSGSLGISPVAMSFGYSKWIKKS